MAVDNIPVARKGRVRFVKDATMRRPGGPIEIQTAAGTVRRFATVTRSRQFRTTFYGGVPQDYDGPVGIPGAAYATPSDLVEELTAERLYELADVDCRSCGGYGIQAEDDYGPVPCAKCIGADR